MADEAEVSPKILARFLWSSGDIKLLSDEEAKELAQEGKALTPSQALLLSKYQEYWQVHSK